MDYLYSLGNVLILLSLSFRNVLYLRVIFALSDVAFLQYGIFTHQYQMIGWAIASLGINLFQIILLIKDMLPKELSKEFRDIKHQFFENLSVSDFLKLMKISKQGSAQNQQLIKKDEPVTALMLITDGAAYIDIDHTNVVQLGHYHFLGEMSYFNKGRASNSVYAREHLKYYYWPYEDLYKLEHKNPSLFMKMVEAMGKDIMLKMINKNKAPEKKGDI